MCYGCVEPKYAMREAADRLKGVSFEPLAVKSDTDVNAPARAFGLLAWMRAARVRLMRKDAAHV